MATLYAIALLASTTACHAQQTGKRMIPYSDLTKAVVAPADHRIAYGDEPLQFGDLRLPSGNSKAPVVVLIHGGCWQSQYDIKHIASAADALTKDGFATWTVEYRRVGDANGGWPGTFDDISRAVDYVRTLSKQYARLDTSHIVLMGHSAGGQLALWAASRKQGEMTGLYASSLPPLRVAGVVSLAGITDLAAYGAASGSCNVAVTPLMGGTATEQPARYKAVSPFERAPIGVPVHLVHGDADPIVPLAQSTDFAAKSASSTVRTIVDVVPGAGHFDLVSPASEAWATVLSALHALAGP